MFCEKLVIMRNLVVELHGSVLAILMVLPAAAVFLKTTPSLEITAPHCCSTVKVTRTVNHFMWNHIYVDHV